MDRFDDDNLFAELRELRPKPRPEFTAELDERAAAGFPRGADTTASVFAPIIDWWRGTSPRRRLMPVLAVAFSAVVLATAAVAISESGGGGTNPAENAVLSEAPSRGAVEAESGAVEAESGSTSGGGGHGAPSRQAKHSAQSPRHHSSGETVYETELPSVESTEAESSDGQFEGNFFGDEEGAEEESAGEEDLGSTQEERESIPAPAQSGLAAHRDIEQSAYIVLGTRPGEVSSAAAKVYVAVHAADGIVLHSSINSGSKGATGATFQLLIPSDKVNDTLASISQIAEVRSRHDTTNDITAPTVSASEELADSGAAIEGLLKELGDVETEAERESVEARLHEERRRHARIRASLDHLHERSSMSEVTVRIVTGNGAGLHPGGGGSDGGGWGVGDALHDAGHILTIAAGVILIGLAILAPIALIALIFWAGNRFRIRRLRERALG